MKGRDDARRALLWWGLGALLIVASTLWVSGARRSAAQLATGQHWEASGDPQRAARHYQWSARAYTPFSASPHRALELMWSLARRIEATQPTLSLEIYELMRGAIWSTRWLMTPYDEWSARVDEEIIRLRGDEKTRVALAQALAVDPRPPVYQSALLLVSSIFAVFSLVRLLGSGLTAELKPTAHFKTTALSLGGAILLFYISLRLGV